MGEEGISKILDRFLLSEQLVSFIIKYWGWTHRCGISEHIPILFEWVDHQRNCAYPFKFNQAWLDNVDFIKMI